MTSTPICLPRRQRSSPRSALSLRTCWRPRLAALSSTTRKSVGGPTPGGVINSTLRYALNALRADWKITTDNFLIRARGEDVDGRTFADTLASLGKTDYWDDESVWKEVAEALPSYRLSKFQPLMPPWIEREVLARYLLDVDRAKAWLLSASR